jgi:hypothetical protein
MLACSDIDGDCIKSIRCSGTETGYHYWAFIRTRSQSQIGRMGEVALALRLKG